MYIILFLPKPIWFLCKSIVLTTNSLLSLCFPFLDGTQELIIRPRQFFSVKIPKNYLRYFIKEQWEKKIFKGVHHLIKFFFEDLENKLFQTALQKSSGVSKYSV